MESDIFLDERKIRRLLAEKDLPLGEFCSNLKMGKNTLYSAFKGHPVSKRTLFRLAVALNVEDETELLKKGE